jgi:hypothetical protein
VQSAAQLCEADSAQILRPRGGGFYSAASYGHSAEFSEFVKNFTFPPGRASVTGRVLLEGKTLQIPDVLADAEYGLIEVQKLGGFRTHAEGSLSFCLPRQFRLRGVVPSPHGQKVTHGQGPLPAGAASSPRMPEAIRRHMKRSRRDRLRAWGGRTRSAPGDRQGVGGASPLR